MKKRRFIRLHKGLAEKIGFKEGWVLVEETKKPGRVRPIRQATRLEGAFQSVSLWAVMKYCQARWYIRREWKWILVWAVSLAACALNLYRITRR